MKKSLLLIIFQLSLVLPVSAQGTLDDYNRAYAFQRTLNYKLVKNYVDYARWLSDGRFQYHLSDPGQGLWHFGQVNADGSITLADSTSEHPIEAPEGERSSWRGRRRSNRDQGPVRFIANPSKRRVDRHWMETDDERSADPVLSPDSSLVAFVRNDNVFVAKPDGSEARALTTEGTLSHYFSSYIQWSPDGRYVSVNRIRPIEKRYVYYVESSPTDQLQPVLHKQEYSKPGDELAQKTPYLIEVASGRSFTPASNLVANQYSLEGPQWREDSRGVRFEYNQRGHKLYRVYEMDVEGNVRVLIEERAETYVRYSNNYRRNLYGDSLILWLSERDGYPHLYSLTPDAPSKNKGSKTAKNKGKAFGKGNPSSLLGNQAESEAIPLFQITSGPWCVRRVIHIDEEQGVIYFTANGRNAGEDPYHIHYYRINLDGTGLLDLTPEPANHNARFNSDYSALIDTYSTQETAPTTVVRSLSPKSSSVKEKETSKMQKGTTKHATPASNGFGDEAILATADLSDLKAAGWVAPEVFVAPGRDGVTPMWGIIQRPSNFDPSKKYPVIEYIYSGPGDSYTPKSFQPYNWTTTSLAELGFIVVQLDAMGTSNRGKKFEEVCYKNLKDAGFPDRIAWIKAATQKYPYMDVDRVGIYGCSAGGQESTAAVLFHGDFYKAAYSACGCHDNRMDKIWWNEQWMSYPIDSSYVECSNVENAYRLERPLMLLVGELDDNVDPASTMQVANALIKANKPFELVVIPGAHHTMGESYGEHKRYDFFVKNLLGIDPPAWSAVQTK